MPYTKNDFPDAMKNLSETVRHKAIEITNRLLEDNYEEGRAISIGIAQAKEWYENRGESVSSDITHHLLPQDKGWVLKDSKDKIVSEYERKDEAMQAIKERSDREAIKVMIHDSDGKFQKVY